MLKKMDKVLLAVALIALTTRTVAAIDCYQCVGTDPVNPFLCNEFLEDDQDLSPRGCDDVYGASFCVKHIGRFEATSSKFYNGPTKPDYKICSPVLSNILLKCNDTENTEHSTGIKCFQCDSAQAMDCSDVLINEPDNTFTADECDDVFEAQFCIKSTALRGGIGTKRYCSALDLGNYCNYVQHIGDQLEYRSCVYTCNTDGCNGSSALAYSFWLLCLPAVLLAARAR